MDHAALYHRTYLPDGAYVDVCNKGCHGPSKPSTMPRTPFALPPPQGNSGLFGNPPSPLLPPKPKPYFTTQRRFAAYRLAGSHLAQIHIVEKIDQAFAEHATPWEQQFSKLLNERGADPVVDDGHLVVGHLGWFNGAQIIYPRGVPRTSLTEMLAAGVPVFTVRHNPDESHWWHYQASEELYQLMVGIDGSVFAQLGRDTIGLEPVDVSPLDLIAVGKGVADLGAVAIRKLARSLATSGTRKGATRLFVGPTAELAQHAVRKAASSLPARTRSFIGQSGMTQSHFHAFQQAAQESKLIVVVRNTNQESTQWIAKGFPGKPITIKVKTSKQTGIVTATQPEHWEQAYKQGYYVVDADGIARRRVVRGGQEAMEELRPGGGWPLEKGQVIDPVAHKPLVGDYDLMGVINPAAPGRNIALVASNGEKHFDINSPLVREFAERVNKKLDRPRVLHGAQDQYGGFDGGCTAFFPDGSAQLLPDETAVKELYEQLGRQTSKGAYPTPPPGSAMVDELALRRGRR